VEGIDGQLRRALDVLLVIPGKELGRWRTMPNERIPTSPVADQNHRILSDSSGLIGIVIQAMDRRADPGRAGTMTSVHTVTSSILMSLTPSDRLID